MTLKKFLVNQIDDEQQKLMDEFCAHLRQIDGTCTRVTLLDLNSRPEGIFKFLPSVEGCVKIEGRNLDMIIMQVGRADYTFYNFSYIVQADIEGLDGKLHVDFRSDWHDRCCLKKDFKWIDKASIT